MAREIATGLQVIQLMYLYSQTIIKERGKDYAKLINKLPKSMLRLSIHGTRSKRSLSFIPTSPTSLFNVPINLPTIAHIGTQ